MGRLHELLQQKVQNVIEERYNAEVVEDKKEEVEFKKYNQSWLLKVTGETGWIVNSDRDHAQKILNALNNRNGQCPCGGNGKQYTCPCINMREYGICKCGLFENVVPVQPKGKSLGRIKAKE